MMHLFALLIAGLLGAVAPHVRPDGAELRTLVTDTAERSSTFRQLVDRIERSDVVVYIRTQHFASERLDGRIGFVRGAGGSGTRILLVELACPRTAQTQATTLAHELHHATEIADAPWVRDARSLEAYYRTIGEETTPLSDGTAFETSAARTTAARVRRELSAPPRLAHEDE